MGLFDFVEQNYAVRLAPYGLRQLSAFLITYISGRCSNQTGDTEFFLILTHINSRHQRFVVE